MKVDRRRPSHWGCLVLFFLQAVLALIVRAMRKRTHSSAVVLYGHKLNGNLFALHEAMARAAENELSPVFLTMDIGYKRELEASGVRSVWACGWGGMTLLAEASAVISDHGLHSMEPLIGVFQRMGVRFFDVWHGIPFKGFDARDFRLQLRYDETWVASELCRSLYVRRFGFNPDRVVATGYARTDRLLRPPLDRAALRSSLGLPPTGALLLFAPTWKQDAAGRSLYPFGLSEAEFLGSLARLAKLHGAAVVLRTHLNSGDRNAPNQSAIHTLPASRFPDSESILLACDILVCDWSSIAFDFLLLDRPTIFLDVAPPFRKGFSLGPEYRFGPVVLDMEALLTALRAALVNPREYWLAYAPKHDDAKFAVYGGLADGGAAVRCLQRLRGNLWGYSRSNLLNDRRCGDGRRTLEVDDAADV